MNPQDGPQQCHTLILLAKTWGSNDNGDRADKLSAALAQDIAARQAADGCATPLLICRSWLGDTDQMQPAAKDAHLACTALVLAAEEA